MKNSLSYILLALTLSGCAVQDSADVFRPGGGASFEDTAQELLAAHDIVGANQAFATNLSSNPNDGSSIAGKAITDFLLMPFSTSVGDVLVENLGASAPLTRDDDIIYGEQGFLYFSARGTPWDPADGLSGIRTILADQLPWEQEKLADPVLFVEAMQTPVNELASNITDVADELGQISADLQKAIDSESFNDFFLPGEVFHAEKLAIRFSRTELAMLAGMIDVARAAGYFVAAYEHDWTFSKAFGSGWEAIEADPEHPEHVAGFDSDDYAYTYLNANLGRSIAVPARLVSAGNALQRAIGSFRNVVAFALDGTSLYLDFDAVDSDTLEDFDALLAAFQGSIEGPTQIPDATPPTSIDLSEFFTDGRVIPADAALFEKVDEDISPFWDLSEDGLRAFGDDAFNPNDDFEYAADEELSNALENVFDEPLDSAQDTFL